ncbi:MAG: hypothetical protein FWH18_12045 [Marinilabiliaceae bacterium]|nr:hypothetical protein [Marinilabiliaceae bacterium]
MKKEKASKENSIFKLIEIKYEDDKPKYPEFKISFETLGYFSSVLSAEKAIRKKIKRYKSSYTFGYLIKEHVLDLLEGTSTKSERSYLSDGSFWDETNMSQLDIDNKGWTNFEGRSEDKIRFKPGDIVEMVSEYHKDISLGIVHCTPPTIEEAKHRTDDHYYVTPHDATWGNDGCTHYHLVPVDLFPPRFRINQKLRKKLEKVYKGIQKEVFFNYI